VKLNERSGRGDTVVASSPQRESRLDLKILTTHPHALPPELLGVTEVLATPEIQGRVRRFSPRTWIRRAQQLRCAWRLFERAPGFGAVVTLGSLEGMVFAALQRFRGTRRPVHVMYDCLWYGGNPLKRAWMRFCLKNVDRCVIWASVESQRYAEAYGVSEAKFAFVPHHHTLHRYTYELADNGYVFTGGNADRDYGLFFEAVRDLPVTCVLATNRPALLSGLAVPANVRIVSASPAEFRQLMARARIVVMPMRATLLHAGAQQSILNAMCMGKAVVLTDPEGGSDYIENGKTGVLIPYDDAAALSDAIRRLLDDPVEADAIGQRARAVAQGLTTEKCNRAIWELTLHLASERDLAADCRPANPTPYISSAEPQCKRP
jgi:glycosyltransferase involved in cell wall biosynthesis